MKIPSISDAIRSLYSVRERPEGDPGQQNQRERREEKPQEELNEKAATPEEIEAAVAGFAQDEQAQANGLSASTVGQGPGLKVVLKDASGSVLRQYSGAEFLELRRATSQNAKGGPGVKMRGKLLDQKF